MKTKPLLFRILLLLMLMLSFISLLFILKDFYDYCLAESIDMKKLVSFGVKTIVSLMCFILMLYLLLTEDLPAWLTKLLPKQFL